MNAEIIKQSGKKNRLPSGSKRIYDLRYDTIFGSKEVRRNRLLKHPETNFFFEVMAIAMPRRHAPDSRPQIEVLTSSDAVTAAIRRLDGRFHL